MQSGTIREFDDSRSVHVVAVLTCLVALLPIGMGALTTTLKAGMAFPDWPTSDGYGMFDYPWLKAALDKFVEHGHRLAGMLIGFVSIVLVAVAWGCSRRKVVRVLALVVFASVSLQGLLGGGRVLANDARMAMFHGLFAAVVFAVMVILAVMTSKRWLPAHDNWQAARPNRDGVTAGGVPGLKTRALCWCLPAVVLLQYSIGGLVRHLGTGLYEHLAGAGVVLVFGVATVTAVLRSRTPALRRTAITIGCVLVLQILLGLGAWVTKFGYAPLGYTAVVNSPAQMIVRSSHTFGGMALFAAAVTLTVVCQRVTRLSLETESVEAVSAGAERGRGEQTMAASHQRAATPGIGSVVEGGVS